MQCEVAPWISGSVCRQLDTRHAAVTAPFVDVFNDYLASMQRARELEVRMSQLDKETAELREENVSLQHRAERLDKLAVHANAAQAEEAKASVVRLEREVGGLYRDKARLLEEHVAANTAAAIARGELEKVNGLLTQARAEIVVLREQVASTSSALETERQGRLAATHELQSSSSTREAAVVETERLRTENADLLRRLVQLKETEAARMEEIGRMHDEMNQAHVRQQKEAAAEHEAADLIRLRTQGSGGGAAVAGGGSPFAAGGVSLRDTMHLLPSAGGAHGRAEERQLPKAPYRSVAAHRGGCCALAVQNPGHIAASCGMDRTAALWDLNVTDAGAGPCSVLQGVTGTVNDVAFTCDGTQLLGAGADKAIMVWDVSSGQQRHTLTGHSASVSAVVCSPLDVRLAVSCSDDRTFKLWDLVKGFSTRTMPCTRMPTALAMTRDGNTIVTGHMDGSLCLWDVRQSRSGSANAALHESRDCTAAITSVAPSAASDSVLLVSAKDNTLRLWDFRAATTQRTLRAPQFAIGTIGSMGRGRCSLELSPDGRFLPAGGADGGVFVWEVGRSAPAGKESLTVMRHHKEAVVAAHWSTGGDILLTADKAGVVAFWGIK